MAQVEVLCDVRPKSAILDILVALGSSMPMPFALSICCYCYLAVGLRWPSSLSL